MKVSVSFLLVLVLLAFFLKESYEAMPKVYKCMPKERMMKDCPMTYKPVCAHNPHMKCMMGKCPKFMTYRNRCMACMHKNVDYVYYGKCHSLYQLM